MGLTVPSEGTTRAGAFCAFHFVVELSVGAAECLPSKVRASFENWQDMTFVSIPSLIYKVYLRSCAGLLRWGAAESCCGGVLEVHVRCTSLYDTRDKFVDSHLFGIILS